MKRLFKWGCLTTLLLVGAVIGYVFWQLNQLGGAIADEAPLAIERVPLADPGLATLRSKTPPTLWRLTGHQLTGLIQAALRHPEMQRALIDARKNIKRDVAQLDDPTGWIKGLKLDELILEKAQAAVLIKDGELTIQTTTPYENGAHFNLQATIAGRFADGEGTFDLHEVRVGNLDLLNSLMGSQIRKYFQESTGRIHHADQGPIKSAHIQGEVLVIEIKPEKAAEVQRVLARVLGGT